LHYGIMLRFYRRARLDGRARVQIGDLAELNVACAKLGAIETHKKWSKDIEPDIVSGTMHWQVFQAILLMCTSTYGKPAPFMQSFRAKPA
jgi:hypothetical protein